MQGMVLTRSICDKEVCGTAIKKQIFPSLFPPAIYIYIYFVIYKLSFIKFEGSNDVQL